MNMALSLPQIQLPPLTEIEKEIERRRLKRSHLEFTKKFFHARENKNFLVAPYHSVISATLDRVYKGEIPRLIINIPPGYSKTEMAVVNFIAMGLAINPGARFIHASYAEELALFNSTQVKDILALEEFQELWPVTYKDDTKAKGLWRTSDGGGMRAAASGRPITGFRAGRIRDEDEEWEFTGALIIDDPLKPDDASSKVQREFINNRWQNTFKSRLAQEDVPVIVIMQRLHIEDFVQHVLETSGEQWHVLKLPIEIDGECDPIHENAIMIPHGLPEGPLWEWKHDQRQIDILKLDQLTFSGQYAQEPIADGGNLFKEEYFQGYVNLPKLAWRAIYVDTAQKDKERNDFSVFEHWGATADGRAYLIDIVRGRFQAPELEKTAGIIWNKAKGMDPTKYGHLRKMVVEDKVSGTGLIQTMKRKSIPVIALQREKDKYTRGQDVLPSVASGLVYIPVDAPFSAKFMNEVLQFPDGSFDDQVDPFMDAVLEICGGQVYTLDNVG